MLAGIAAALPFPYLSLISLATCSQTSALREEITTLAPCSAILSAMARPIPRVEPVMTATFPFMSNKLMFLSRVCFQIQLRRACRVPTTSGELAFGCDDLRSRRLMHGGVPRIGDPGLLVHHRKPPV